MKAQIMHHLPGDFPWQNQILWYDVTDSTNAQAKAMAAAGAPHGTVLIADHQTGGRGRMGRSFSSPAGMGIYMSVILRPNCRPDALMHLTCAAAVAMCNAVEAVAGIRPGIKWTNDLVYGKRKLAGILTELSIDSKTGNVSHAIVGIGINCCQSASDFPEELSCIATSLSMASGKKIHRDLLSAAIIQSLLQMDASLFSHKKAIMDAYRTDCITIGQDIAVHGFEGIRHGKALDVSDNGALVVQFLDGHTEAVSAGEVSVRGMYGYV